MVRKVVMSTNAYEGVRCIIIKSHRSDTEMFVGNHNNKNFLYSHNNRMQRFRTMCGKPARVISYPGIYDDYTINYSCISDTRHRGRPEKIN